MAHVRRTTTIPAPIVVNPSQKFEGNDGAWSTFTIQVGTPAQSFRVLISTASSETWVVVPQGCTSSDPSNCASLRGAEPFNGQASTGFQVNMSSTWNEIGLYSLDLETSLGYTGNGLYGYDVVGINGGNSSGGISLGGQVIAGVADKDYFMGMLGLSDRPDDFSSSSKPVNSFLSNMFNANLIPSLSFGYTAGAQYQGKGTLGNLILGGYDQSRFKPTDFSFSFASVDARPLQVGIQSITGSNTLLGVNSFTTSGGFLSLVDSSVPELWVPEAVADSFAAALGLTYDSTTDLYLVNDTMHKQLQSSNPQFTFSLGNTAYENGNNTNLVISYAAFDQQVGWPIYNSTKNYFPIRRAANDTQYTIGRVLLQEAYLVVDYERRNFTLGQAVFPTNQPPADIVTIRSPGSASSSKSSTLGTGAIAGIAVGGAALLIAIAALVFFLRKRKKQEQGQQLDDLTTPELDGKTQYTGLGDAKNGYKYDGSNTNIAELSEVPGDSYISELAGGVPHDKSRPESTISELPGPAPVFEMQGDNTYGNYDAPNVSSQAQTPARMARPSPLGPTREPSSASAGVSPADTWTKTRSPR